MERQQFHKEQLKLAEIRARASQTSAVPPSGTEPIAVQPQPTQVVMASSPQSVQPTLNQPPRVATPGIYLHLFT